MPIYAYQCATCGRDEEYIQKFSDPPMETCEHCEGALHRKLTSAAFHLKGGGWYKDLYASSKPAGGESGGESAPAPAAAATTPAAAPAAAPASSCSTPAPSGSGGSGSGGSKAGSS